MFDPIEHTNMGIAPCCGVVPEADWRVWIASAACDVCFDETTAMGDLATTALAEAIDHWNAGETGWPPFGDTP